MRYGTENPSICVLARVETSAPAGPIVCESCDMMLSIEEGTIRPVSVIEAVLAVYSSPPWASESSASRFTTGCSNTSSSVVS